MNVRVVNVMTREELEGGHRGKRSESKDDERDKAAEESPAPEE